MYGSEYLPTGLVRHQVFASNGAADVVETVVSSEVEATVVRREVAAIVVAAAVDAKVVTADEETVEGIEVLLAAIVDVVIFFTGKAA